MAGPDITIEILKEIRDTARATSARLDSLEGTFNRRFDVMGERLEVVTDRLTVVTDRLDVMSDRLDLVETTLLDVVRESRSTSAIFGFSAGNTLTSSRASARSRAASTSSSRSSQGAYSANGSTQALAVVGFVVAFAAGLAAGAGSANGSATIALRRRAGRGPGGANRTRTSGGRAGLASGPRDGANANPAMISASVGAAIGIGWTITVGGGAGAGGVAGAAACAGCGGRGGPAGRGAAGERQRQRDPQHERRDTEGDDGRAVRLQSRRLQRRRCDRPRPPIPIGFEDLLRRHRRSAHRDRQLVAVRPGGDLHPKRPAPHEHHVVLLPTQRIDHVCSLLF